MANVTISMTSETGDVLYAFPDGKSLSDWTTFRVLLTEGGAGNEGRYYATVNSDFSPTQRFLAFRGASEPDNYNSWVWAWDVAATAESDSGSGYIGIYDLPYIHIIGS